MSNQKLKISIIDDDEDILTLYKDFLIAKGHEVFSYLNADHILANFFKDRPNIVLMDYKIVGHKSGVDAAIEILTQFPLFPILFISAYEGLREDILNYSIFRDKKISILIKPVFLKNIEDAILNLIK